MYYTTTEETQYDTLYVSVCSTKEVNMEAQTQKDQSPDFDQTDKKFICTWTYERFTLLFLQKVIVREDQLHKK
jgi:hypothetical protein